MLWVRYLAEIRLLVVKFRGNKSYTQIFDCAWVGAPNPCVVQG